LAEGGRGPRPERLRLPLTAPQAVADTSALLWRPSGESARPGLVLGHSAGTPVTDPLLGRIAAGLAGHGHPVLAFNFAYSEAGRRPPDPAARLEAAFGDAVAFARPLLEGPLLLGGRSMGGRIASHLAARGEPCGGLVLLGYPLHPARRPERLRTAHWPDLRVPMLFVQGDRDRLCDLDLLERERRRLLGRVDARVHPLAGADHGFRVRGRPPQRVTDEVVAVVAGWLATLALQNASGQAR
jgi:predicted alpha/beta-hydrolase family hydrolase